MNDPWYKLRTPTLIAVGVVVALFLAMNAHDTHKGLTRVMLTEDDSKCVAYQVIQRGWPQVFSVRYEFDNEATTILGFPKRKYLEDEFKLRGLGLNLLLGFVVCLVVALGFEVTLRLFFKPKPVAVEEPPQSVRAISAVRESVGLGEV
jgi:hypothetical protein